MAKLENTFKICSVSASVFLNEGEEGSFRTITLQRRYRDGNEWKSSSSFTASNAPAAIAVLQKALNYLLDQPDSEEEEAPSHAASDERPAVFFSRCGLTVNLVPFALSI